jgi:hypothetical protein
MLALGVLSHSPALLRGAALALILWPLVEWWIARRRLPAPYAALAYWGRRAGHGENFAAAWWMESRETPAAAEQAHLAAQTPVLREALPNLSADIPLPPLARLVPAPVLVIALLSAPLLMRSKPGDTPVSAAVREEAARQAKELRGLAPTMDKLDTLDPGDAAKAEALIQAAAESLEQASNKAARDILAATDQAAREIEDMTASEPGADEPWASPELLEVLRKQTDTADLGDAVAARNPGSTAAAADALAEALRQSADNPESMTRLGETFDRAASVAQPEDQSLPVGSAVTAADANLDRKQPADAAGDLEALAGQMRSRQAREAARQELQRLANKVRQAGERAANADSAAQGGSVRELAKASGQPGDGQNQAQDGQSRQQEQTEAPQNQQASPAGGQGSQAEVAGAFSEPNRDSQDQGAPQQGASQGVAASQDKAGDSPPRLFAPVPGQGDKPDGPALIVPVAGQDGGQQFSALGGDRPGTGTSEPFGEETDSMKSRRQALVQAADSGAGPSSTRQIQGGSPRPEDAGTASTPVDADFEQTLENAVSDTALPATRRDHIRRYFNELRRALEK